jgi:hypothetical protein
MEKFWRRFQKRPSTRTIFSVNNKDQDGRFVYWGRVDDEIVLAPAIAAEAEILIIGDKDLFDVADQVDALRITTPPAFREEVRQFEKASRRESVQDAHVSRGRFCQVRTLIRPILETGAA